MIIKRFFNKLFYTQNVILESNFFLQDIANKNFLFSSNLSIRHLNQEASYNFSNNYINIPKNFFHTDLNFKQFTSIEKIFHKKTLNFIVLHEIGHLSNHQFLSLHLNQHFENFEYITLDSKSNYIKTNTSLDSLLYRS